MPKDLKPTLPKLNAEIGDTGTYIWHGVIEPPDPNRDLVGHKGLLTFDRMRLGDASVRAALLACKLPILSANWRVDPASDSPQDKEIAQFVEDQLHGMSRSWEEFLREALLHLDFGRYLFEIVYQLTPDGRIGLKKLAARQPKTIYAWEMSDGGNGVQQLTTKGGMVDIPIEKLIIFVNEKEGDNWEGISILRAAYKAWHMKETLEKIDAIAHERQSVGIPQIKPSVNPSDAEKRVAIETAEGLRANAKGYAYIPAGWDMEFMDMKANTSRDPLESAQYHRFEILLSVLAAFLQLGSQKTGGSRALSQDLSDFFEMAVKHVATVGIAAPMNRYLIPRLVDLNYTVEEYPKLVPDGIGSVDFAAITNSLTQMNQAKVLTPTLDIEQSLRRTMGLPEAPEDTYYPDPTKEPPKPPRPPVPPANPDNQDTQPAPNDTPLTDAKPPTKKEASQQAFLKHFIASETKALKEAVVQLARGRHAD